MSIGKICSFALVYFFECQPNTKNKKENSFLGKIILLENIYWCKMFYVNQSLKSTIESLMHWPTFQISGVDVKERRGGGKVSSGCQFLNCPTSAQQKDGGVEVPGIAQSALVQFTEIAWLASDTWYITQWCEQRYLKGNFIKMNQQNLLYFFNNTCKVFFRSMRK